MIRKKKNYSRPKRRFEKSRIEEENKLVMKYGLKNKKEIWKTLAKVNYYRSRAKALARSSLEDQEVLFNKLKAIGLNTGSIADVLDLKVEDLLERRLPTIVAKKGIAETVKQARQMVVHKKILVGGNVVNSPSYVVQVSLESTINVKKKAKKPKVEKKEEPAEEEAPKEEKVEEKAEEVKEETSSKEDVKEEIKK